MDPMSTLASAGASLVITLAYGLYAFRALRSGHLDNQPLAPIEE